jgi:hypothetical protein
LSSELTRRWRAIWLLPAKAPETTATAKSVVRRKSNTGGQ